MMMSVVAAVVVEVHLMKMRVIMIEASGLALSHGKRDKSASEGDLCQI